MDSAEVQTTAKYIQFDAWAGTGTNRYNEKRKQSNLCISGTNFVLIKTEYLNLFMRFKNQNQKHVFPKFKK